MVRRENKTGKKAKSGAGEGATPGTLCFSEATEESGEVAAA